MDTQKLTLGNLANGAAEAMFEREVERVMKNIQDINTPATIARTITLQVKIKPSETRDVAAAIVKITSSLPGIQDKFASLLFGKENNKLVAMQQKQLQQDLDFNVVEMESKND